MIATHSKRKPGRKRAIREGYNLIVVRGDLLTVEAGMFERITFDPNIMGGRACIRGMRIPVSVIVGQIAHGATFEEIPDGYPDLEREDIQQAIEHAAWLARNRFKHPSGECDFWQIWASIGGSFSGCNRMVTTNPGPAR
jgi:uncharacterized protein (DUF433 family)